MNAYELADAIEDWDSDGQWDTPAANMLRQQADRIAELESCLDFALKDTMDYITLNNLDGENNHWLVWARKLLVNKTPQTKPLSDEEIKQIWYNLYPLSSSSYWDDKREGLAELKFAKAIEERHGIK